MTTVQHRAKGRGNGEGSIYQRSDGKWCGAISLEGGKRKVLYGRTRKDVADKLADVLPAVKRGLPVPGQRLTTAAFLADWLEHTVKPSQKPHTYHAYETAIRTHIVPAIGSVALAKLTPQHVQRLQAGVAAKGRKPKTVRLVRGVLSAALTRAEKWGLVARNVVRLVDGPQLEEMEPRVLTSEQAAALLEAAEGHEMQHLFALLLSTGLRINEALGLQWSAVELDGRSPVLHVRQQAVKLPNAPRAFAAPKSRTGRRVVPLIGAAQEALRLQHVKVLEMRMRVRPLWQDNDLVFPNAIGELESYQRAEVQLARLCKKAGLEGHYTPHALRHSAGTYLTAVGVPDRVVMEILGHSSTDMTRRYQHVLSTMLEDAAKRLDSVFPKSKAASA